MPKPSKTPIFQPGTSASKSFATKTLSVDMDARTVKHYISCPTVDSDGDVLLPRGADISRFRLTGTIFDVHNYGSKDVVGRNMTLSMQDDGIIATTRFSPRPPSLPAGEEWWPDTLLWLYNIGDIKGWSVGFTILDARNPTKQDLAKWGPDLQRVITRWLVLEYSVAPLPANGDALTLSARGMLSKRLADHLSKGQRPTKRMYALLEEQPKQSVRLEIPAEPINKKRVVFFVSQERSVVSTAPVESLEQIIASSTEIAMRKARGQIYA